MLDIQNIKKSHTISDQRPFLGLRPFEEKNKSQFGGRDKEIRELFGLIENRGLTVVFGKSGIGKTSLLKAGLMPELRQNFYFPMYLRIDFSCATTPLQQLRKFIFEEMKKKDPTILPIGGVTLWEYFHHIKLLDGLVTPFLISSTAFSSPMVPETIMKGISECFFCLMWKAVTPSKDGRE